MVDKYDHKVIEPKWQKYWEEKGTFKAVDGDKRPKFYVLDMFAYPSGEGLHAGHPRGYVATDIFARYRRMKGDNVLRPIGWDAFGLPAENYAIKIGKPPAETTKVNIARFTEQVRSFGFAYDWGREVDTSDPNYYKWTQWIFKVLYDAGLAYQKEAYVNWCPKDQTVLANEQVVGGCCERCGTQVEQRKLKQWFFKITNFAEELLGGLDKLDWPESTKTGQRNWIGRSEGAVLKFSSGDVNIDVFTTRPDTLFGATYLVLAPEHELVEKLTTPEQKTAVEKYVAETKLKTHLDRTMAQAKTGVFTGSLAMNPATGKEIPVWIADYVLTDYGTGAIMAVPAHDERDFEFAKKFDLPVMQVIKSDEKFYAGHGELVNSGEFDGQDSAKAGAKIAEKFDGKMAVQYKLHDWLISRQRYWGVPIPIIYLTDGKTQSVDEKDLPVLLPEDVDFKPTGESPLAKSKTFQTGVKEKYGKGAHRELDTMDTFVCSSWYYLRYCDPRNDKEFAGKESLKYWMPVDLYIGGAEHTTGHLLYARFITKALHKLGYLDFDEPFLKLRHQGLILGPDGEKMSKSRGNVINPDDLIEQYGADAVRMYEMFMGPFDQAIAWDTNGISGVRAFLDKTWRYFEQWEMDYKKDIEANPSELKGYEEEPMGQYQLERSFHSAIKGVTEDIEQMKFNTAVSKLMVLMNELRKEDIQFTSSGARIESSESHTGLPKPVLARFILLLSPFAPHLAEELWQGVMKKKGSVCDAKAGWPTFDEAKVVLQTVVVAVQEKGKLRGTVEMPVGAGEQEVLAAVEQNEKLRKVAGAASKHIFVKDKVINFI